MKSPFVSRTLDVPGPGEYTWQNGNDSKGNEIMWTRMGIWCLLGAFFMWLFSGISILMQADNVWVDLTLSRILGQYADSVITFGPVATVENTLYFLVEELPFYGVVLGLGTLFLVAGMFVKIRS
jgi:hypothetical protein